MISKQNENRIRAALAEIAAALEDDTGAAATPAPTPEGQRVFPDDYFVDYGAFYDFLRTKKMFGPTLEDDEWKGCEAIIRAFALHGSPISHCAYGLATPYLETKFTMQPVKEAFWLSDSAANRYFHKMYDIQGSRPSKARELGNLSPGDGTKYAGRGYVQLTGKRNYRVLTERLRAAGHNVDLVNRPDEAMKPNIAALIMVIGMTEGLFTTRKLSDDLPSQGPATFEQFEASRDIINGRDRDDEIARFAIDFQTALLRAGYKA